MSMAKSDRDRQALQQTMKAIIAGSKRTSAKVPSQASLPGMVAPTRPRPQSHDTELPERVAELVHAIPTERRLSDLVLAPQVIDAVKEFIDEFTQAPLLRAHSLEPRHTVLLLGPPGNGKTSLAESMATELSLPLLSVRYDAIVDSFLGETSNRLRRLIEYATQNPCVLFFDEFEAVGKERSDAQETGEIKRVVSTLLVGRRPEFNSFSQQVSTGAGWSGCLRRTPYVPSALLRTRAPARQPTSSAVGFRASHLEPASWFATARWNPLGNSKPYGAKVGTYGNSSRVRRPAHAICPNGRPNSYKKTEGAARPCSTTPSATTPATRSSRSSMRCAN
jgi:hypothetical protein